MASCVLASDIKKLTVHTNCQLVLEEGILLFVILLDQLRSVSGRLRLVVRSFTKKIL